MGATSGGVDVTGSKDRLLLHRSLVVRAMPLMAIVFSSHKRDPAAQLKQIRASPGSCTALPNAVSGAAQSSAPESVAIQ